MEQENTISPFTKHAYLCEIDFQSRIALRAWDRLDFIGKGLDHSDIWSSIQVILNTAGNVSKILWPSRRASSLRGKVLRELLNVDKSNPLSKRTFRNHFEHYDERIDDWFASRSSGSYTDFSLGPPQGYARQFPSNVHRGYDYTTQTLTLRGESLDLGALVKALAEIRQKSRSTIFL